MTMPIIVSYRQGHASGSVPCKPDELSTTVDRMLKQYRHKPGGTRHQLRPLSTITDRPGCLCAAAGKIVDLRFESAVY